MRTGRANPTPPRGPRVDGPSSTGPNGATAGTGGIAGTGSRGASPVQDGVDDAPAPGARPAPSGWSRLPGLSALPHLAGRFAKGAAVAGVLLGAIVGTQLASPTPASAPAPVVVTAPAPTEAGRSVRALFGDVARALPAGQSLREVLSDVGSVTFSVRADRGLTAVGSKLEVDPGTSIAARLDRSGLSFSANPGVGFAIDWLPDATIERVTYDFQTARFRAVATGLLPDSFYTSRLEAMANEKLAPYLPAAMRQPGYDPFTDPALDANVAHIVDALSSGTEARPTRAPSGDVDVDLARISAPALSLDYVVAEAREVALPGTDLAARFAAGTRVYVSTSTTGSIGDPQLSSLEVRFSQPVVVAPAGEPPGAFKRIEVSSLRLSPDAQLTMQYELGPEQVVDGLRALAVLFAVAADPRVATRVGPMSATRLESVRGEVQARLDADVEPRIVALLRAHDHAIEGRSLLEFFGVRPDR